MLGEKHHLEVYEKRRLETAEKAKETSAHSQAAPLKFAKLYKNLTVEERDDFLFSDDCPKYRKIPKLSPGAYIRRGLSTKGNLRFKLDWASLIVGSKFTVFAHCFTLYLRAIFQVQASGGLYLEGRFNGGFFALPVWGAYIWRGLYMEGLIFGILRYLFQLPNPKNDIVWGSQESQVPPALIRLKKVQSGSYGAG